MEIRKIKPEEKIVASLLSTVVFLEKESEDYKSRLENPLAHSEGYENIWAGFDDNGKMCSCLHAHNFTIRFDGHDVGMGGIGGVSTLPECRKGGYIRKIFDQCLPEMKERGTVFSFLYPFSFAFYRKFGYELCYAHHQVRVPMSDFKEYPYPENVTLYVPGDDLSGFQSVYTAFVQDKNLALVRDTNAWKRLLDKDPYVTRQYAYLHRGKDGKPDAYLLFKADMNGDGDNTLRVREMAWTAPDALHALFGFLGGLSPQFGQFAWNAPGGLNIQTLFPESYDIGFSHPVSGMNRIVDVQRALELLKVPAHTGRVVLSVRDKFLPFNDGTYAVEWEGGGLTVKQTDRTADLETDVETLAQLVTGYLTPAEAQYRRGITVNGNEASLQALFPHKNLYIMEHF